MNTLCLRCETRSLPVYQLSDFQLWDITANIGVVCLDQTGLEKLFSNEESLSINAKEMILHLNPVLQMSTGRHGGIDHRVKP